MADAVAAARAATGAWEPWLGAVVRQVEVRPERPADGPLAGLALGVKDLIAVAGVPRECGAPGLVDAAPQAAHATAVGRMLEAGATVVATTATHQFAYGIVTPQTRNPRARHAVAGGSSGGSAAALAAGICDVALGTDTGGSVRIPAACCGVVGLKTTFGSIPMDGIQPLSPSLDTVGPLARSVTTCAAAYAALAQRPVAPAAGEDAGRPLRIGVIRELASVGMDPEVRAAYEAALAALERDGAHLTRVALPLLPQANSANGRVLAAEALAVHAERLAAFPPEGAGRTLWQPDLPERFERGRVLDAATVESARALGERWRDALREVFTIVDVLLTPTMPCRVPPVGVDPIEVDGRAQPVVAALTRLTNAWNLAGVPAGSVPMATDSGGAPIGMQVIGPWHAEPRVLDVMAALERLSAGPLPAVPAPRANPVRE
jgi:aspartyl-tRNA(Asn)/glutamyl-tRNA(Gln) amidotransferase subunit A